MGVVALQVMVVQAKPELKVSHSQHTLHPGAETRRRMDELSDKQLGGAPGAPMAAPPRKAMPRARATVCERRKNIGRQVGTPQSGGVIILIRTEDAMHRDVGESRSLSWF
jgi:hypothetical protein